MQNAKEKPLASAEIADKPIPSFEEFRAAVKYRLTNDNGMPELVAEEILTFDADFLEQRRKEFNSLENIITKTADEFALEPSKGVKWVRLEEGERTVTENQVVIDMDGPLSGYLDSLVALGLYGRDRDTVASTLLARGIESALPLLAAMTRTGK